MLKVKKVGICGTDLHAYTGNQAFFTYPRILGHELATSVIEIEEKRAANSDENEDAKNAKNIGNPSKYFFRNEIQHGSSRLA